MEYYVADSYKGYELVGVPFEKSGKMYSKARCNCYRCVKGVYVTRIENGQPVPHPNANGVCFACNGTGYIIKEIRLYTEKEKVAADRAKQRQAERKVEEKLAAAERKKAEWLIKNGFTSEGFTAVYIGANSFDVKNELKEQGWKYSPVFGWRSADISAIETYGEDNVAIISADQVVSFNIYGEGCFLSTAANLIQQLRDAHKPQSKSEWIGKVKEKLVDIPVTLVSIHSYTNQFGYSQAVKFETEDKSEIMWFTTANIKIKVGEKGILTGTVKKHDIYKNNKITIVTRCKIS